MSSTEDNKRFEETIQRYLALGIAQVLIGLTMFICPTISLATTAEDQISPGHIYALSVMILLQASMHILIYYHGRKRLSNSSGNVSGNTTNPIGCFITVGIFVGFPEFATTLVAFVITGIFYGADPEDPTNKKLALVILIFCGLAFLANVFTIYTGCTRGSLLGVNFQKRNRQVRTQHMAIITTTRQHGGGRDQNNQIQSLQLQNAMLQQQLLLQQQQQQQRQQQPLSDQQRFANYGFPTAPPESYPAPSSLYTEGLDPAYPPPYSQPTGPPPPYQPK